MADAWIFAARRSAVSPKLGAFRDIEAWELGAAVLKSMLADTTSQLPARTEVILGNALYAGGNPARMAALAAGLPARISALTIDTQCCSGLDAIALARSRIAAGEADLVFAGGVESYSRAPRRFRTPVYGGDGDFYARPPFSPWPDRDPDLIEAHACLAEARRATRKDQDAFAIGSHAKALRSSPSPMEIVSINDLHRDAYTRRLTEAVCARAPVIAGDADYGLTAATIAVEADAAAMVAIGNDEACAVFGAKLDPIRVSASVSQGCAPETPSHGAVAATQALLSRADLSVSAIAVWEVMEAFAVQAQAFAETLAIPQEALNRGGGALARGHPIGASGAILAVRLFHELQREPKGTKGLAVIAAAGGLGSALLMKRG